MAREGPGLARAAGDAAVGLGGCGGPLAEARERVLSLSAAVMGQKVNLAARLMEHYPGVVSCDAATYAASRLPRSYFRELPEAKMKGVVDPGTVYQYLGISEKP